MDQKGRRDWDPDRYSQGDPGYRLDDINGRQEWKDFFHGCSPDRELCERFLLPGAYLFLLCGKAGSGKRTLACAYAGDLMRQGYRFFALCAADLLGEDREETAERISALTERMRQGQTVVLLEELNLLSEPRAAGLLAAELQRLQREGCSFVCLATAERAEEVSPSLSAICFLCPLEPPDEAEREAYFEGQLAGSFACGPGLDARTMAHLSEGCSYAQLAAVVLYVRGMLCGIGQRVCGRQALLQGSGERMVSVTQELFLRGLFLAKQTEQTKKTEQIEKIEKTEMTEKAAEGEETAALRQEDLDDFSRRRADFSSDVQTADDTVQSKQKAGIRQAPSEDIPDEIPEDASIREIMAMLLSPEDI